MEVGYEGILSIEKCGFNPGETGIERRPLLLKNIRAELLQGKS